MGCADGLENKFYSILMFKVWDWPTRSGKTKILKSWPNHSDFFKIVIYIGLDYRHVFKIDFGLWEVPKIDDDDDDIDDDDNDDDDNDDYDVFSSSLRISNTIGNGRGGGSNTLWWWWWWLWRSWWWWCWWWWSLVDCSQVLPSFGKFGHVYPRSQG